MEIFESLRIPEGPFFVRLDVRKASKRLSGWDEDFHSRLIKAFGDIRSSGLPAFLGFVISDEINVLFGEAFGRRLEKIVSIVSSIASLASGEPMDARIVYTPSLLSAVEYLRRRQELGSRNAVIKEAYMRALEHYGDKKKAIEESSKPLDELRRKYSRRIPTRALHGTLIDEEPQTARRFGSEKGRRKLYEILKKKPLRRSEDLVHNRV